jgi:hypothetical protein
MPTLTRWFIKTAPRPDRSRPAPSARLGWASYAFLNTGLLLRVVAEPAAMLDGLTPLRWLLPLSAVLPLSAACAFVALIWPRVKER